MSIAFSFASRRFDQPSGKWTFSACTGGVFFVIQLGLLFIKSKEDIELAEFERLHSAQLRSDASKIENRNNIANAATKQALSQIQSGNLEEAKKWSDFGSKYHGQ